MLILKDKKRKDLKTGVISLISLFLISLLFLGQSLDLGSVVFTLFDLLSKLFTILIPLILILILFRSFMLLVKTK